MVHIPHGPFRGIHRDIQVGIDLQHLYHRRSHRLHTPRNCRADGIHPGTLAEDLWKPLYHPTCDLTMLLFTVARQLSPTFLRIIHHQSHLFQHTMTCRCQFIHTVGMVHHVIRRVITRSTADISRTMTSVVRHIERFLTSRRRSQHCLDRVRIGVIVARGILRLLPDEIHHRLGRSE